MKHLQFHIDPKAKPRMTQRDRWKKRPCVMNYRLFKDELLMQAGAVMRPANFIVSFVLPMPKSWSKKKREKMNGEPHQQKPDLDNLLKGFCDALWDEDSVIWQVTCEKKWGFDGRIDLYWDETE